MNSNWQQEFDTMFTFHSVSLKRQIDSESTGHVRRTCECVCVLALNVVYSFYKYRLLGGELAFAWANQLQIISFIHVHYVRFGVVVSSTSFPIYIYIFIHFQFHLLTFT